MQTVKAGLDWLKKAGKANSFVNTNICEPIYNEKLISEFKEIWQLVNHVTYDAVSEDAALNAFEAMYMESVL